jgi:RNA polymerase sigma factor (sigma-70 family)
VTHPTFGAGEVIPVGNDLTQGGRALVLFSGEGAKHRPPSLPVLVPVDQLEGVALLSEAKPALLRHHSTDTPEPPAVPALPENVVTLRAVDALLGDRDLAADALGHLVNVCLRARRTARWSQRPEFKVQSTGNAGGGQSYLRPDNEARDLATVHVLAWLEPFRSLPPEDVYRAAADGAFRFIAARFSDRWSNAARDAYRRRQLVRFLYADAGVETDEGNKQSMWDTLSADDPATYEDRRLFLIDMKTALARLPPEQSRAFVAIHVEGLTLDKLAKREGITPDGCRTRLSRAVSALKLTAEKYRHLLTR